MYMDVVNFRKLVAHRGRWQPPLSGPYGKQTKFVNNIIDLGQYNAELGGLDVRYSANDMYDDV